MRESILQIRVPIFLITILAFVTTDTQAAVDLAIDSLDLYGETTLLPHREIGVGYRFTNLGDEDSGEFSFGVYLSTDDTITEDDDLRESGTGLNLAPGQTWSGQTVYFRFHDVDRGDYTIGVIIHYADDVDLDNNTSTAGSVTIVRPTDLAIEGLYVDESTIRPGDQIDVVVSVYNDGIGISDSFSIDCYAGDYSIGSGDFGPLDSGQTDSFTVSCAFPSDIAEGDYSVRAVASCTYDENSGNNDGSTLVSIWVGPSVDMVIQSVNVMPGPYLPGDEFVIKSLIENIGGRDSEIYTVVYYLSSNAAITQDDHMIGHIESAGLDAGEQRHHETVFEFPFSIPPGNYYVGAIVTSQDGYDPTMNVGRNALTVELVHPSGYVCGQILYQYKWNWDRTYPIRYALVRIFEDDKNDDPLDDRLFAQTHTDRNGNYAVILSNDENLGNDIYVKVIAEGVSGAHPDSKSKICILKDDVFDEVYSLVSASHPHPQESSVVINMTAPGRGEFMVFDSLVEGFSKAKTLLGVDLKEAIAYWPSEAGTSYFDPCDAGIYISQDDRGDRDVIMHEYGHYVAEIYGVAQGQVGEDPTHYWDRDLRNEPIGRTDEHAMNLAFREAWASVFSIATQYGDTAYLNSGDSRYDDLDEHGEWTFKADLDNNGGTDFSPGQYYENMNAGALWDIFDDKNDGASGNETLSDPSLSMIWTISRDYKPENILDFWNNWFRKYDHEQEMKNIFQAHNMSFAKP